MDHPFRSAAFGGFHRQDVLTYLENTAKENSEKQQQLQQQLDEARQSLTDQAGRLEEREQQLRTLSRERDQLQAQVEQLTQSLQASRVQEERAARELEQARTELETARARAASLEPDAAAYAAVKERTAGVELEAHCRAKAIQTQAEAEAAELRRKMKLWLQRVEREYSDLRSQVESTVAHAADQLERAGGCLEQVNALLGEQDAALEALAQSYAQTDPARAAAPMPISED